MAKSEKVEVAAIEIKYPDGSSKRMTIADARALHEQLNELFGAKIQPVSAPVVVFRERWPRWTDCTLQTKTTHETTFDGTPQIYCCAKS